jgi:8-oxo-dGTP diphosphatase
MEHFYDNADRFLIAVDCVIFGFRKGRLGLLLVRRDVEPDRGLWAVMGGFLKNDESIDQAAKRVLKELTGLDNIYMEQVKLHGEVNRDTGGRVLSQVYYALVNIEDYDHELVADHDAHWVSINDIPPLVFDHLDMVNEALDKLRTKLSTEPIGFNMLPELFTLTQLQSLYEAVYNEKYDKRNFRKRISNYDFIEKTNQTDQTLSKRSAALYRYNANIYKEQKDIKMIVF